MAATRCGDRDGWARQRAWLHCLATPAIVARDEPPRPQRSRIPADLLPADGRFGCGPSKVRPEAVDALAGAAPAYLGTTHRQAPVRFVVAALRNGLAELLSLPDGYEVMLGNGGTTVVLGRGHLRAHRAAQPAPVASASSRRSSPPRAAPRPTSTTPRSSSRRPGTAPEAAADRRRRRLLPHPQRDLDRRAPCRSRRPEGADAASCWSTPPRRPAGCASTRPRSTSTTSPPRSASPPTAGCGWPPCRPAAIERIERIAASATAGCPASLDLGDRPRQLAARTRPTTRPALATLFLAVQQVEWINDNGGLDVGRRRAATARPRSSTAGPRRRDYATPFVTDPASAATSSPRSTSTTSVDAATVSPGAAGQRHRRHRALPQARPQPAARRACSRPSTPTTSPRSPAASTTWSSTSADTRRRTVMAHLVTAIVKPHKLEDVKEAVRGRRPARPHRQRGAGLRPPGRQDRDVPRLEYTIDFVPKVRIEVVVERRRRRRSSTSSPTPPAPARSATARSGRCRSTSSPGSAPARRATTPSDPDAGRRWTLRSRAPPGRCAPHRAEGLHPVGRQPAVGPGGDRDPLRDRAPHRESSSSQVATDSW